MGEPATKNNETSAKLKAKTRRVALAAAKRYVEDHKVTACVMEPGFGYQGTACPVINCYMRCDKTGKCLSQEQGASKATNRAMRDVIAVVDIIEDAMAAPAWATENTYKVGSNVKVSLSTFAKEAGISLEQLQYALDNNELHKTTLKSAYARD